jgi:hypothetical protein
VAPPRCECLHPAAVRYKLGQFLTEPMREPSTSTNCDSNENSAEINSLIPLLSLAVLPKRLAERREIFAHHSHRPADTNAAVHYQVMSAYQPGGVAR